MIAMQHGRAAVLDFTIGGNREGNVQAYRLRSVQDCGAYPGIGAILPGFTALMSSGVYAIPKIEADTVSVVTNTTPIGPFRGAGRPEATQAIERAMDLFAAEIGLDPAEVRRRNLIPPEAFPFTTASGAGYDCGDYERALDLALERADYKALRAEQQQRRDADDPRALGIGVSVYVEITNGLVEPEFGAVEITPEGGAILRTGSFSHGQGHETTFAMIVADRLGLPVEAVRVIKGDTDQVRQGSGTYGSKSHADRRGRGRSGRGGRRRAGPGPRSGAARGEQRRRRARLGGRRVPRRRVARAGADMGRARRPAARRRTARRAAGRGDLQRRGADIPVRRARRRGRGRHGDRRRSSSGATSRSTTPGGSSTRWSPKDRCTEAWLRVSHRRSSRSSSTTTRETP